MANAKYKEMLEQSSAPKMVWKAALYIRLSREDDDKRKQESDSITNQREILKEYVEVHPDIEIVDFYVDDGWSGTNFDRPDFKRMIKDIDEGLINCVIVKDLSRLGRNHVQTGYYIEDYFVRKRVRFISLNNVLDTASNAMNDTTRIISMGVTNIMNENVAATTSINVKGTLNAHRKRGYFIGSFATYGYLKDPSDKHRLIVDPETAPIIKMIFKEFIGGKSIIGIAKMLNGMGIPNPATYKRKVQGFNYQHPAGESDDGFWPDSTVRRILQNQMYLGHMVQGKNRCISYKLKLNRPVPRDEWIIVEGTHEAIIDEETFDKAQSLFNKHIRKAPKKNEVDLFSGFVCCADCGRAMNKKTNVHPYGTYHYYRCVTARKMDKGGCTNHTIRIDKLEEIVLTIIQKMVDTAVETSDILEIINNNEKRNTESVSLKELLEQLSKEREKVLRLQTDLYPDYKDGVISREEYDTLRARLEERKDGIDKRIEDAKAESEKFKEGINYKNEFVSHFKQFGRLNKLTRNIAVELIDKILVHEGGDIEVQFKFQDAYKEALEYIELNKNIVKKPKKQRTKKSA